MKHIFRYKSDNFHSILCFDAPLSDTLDLLASDAFVPLDLMELLLLDPTEFV